MRPDALPIPPRCLRALLLAFAAAAVGQEPPMPEALLDSLEWRCIGPSRGGRVSSVTGVSADRDTYYLGATGGGVWKTTDAGRTWKCVSDGFFGGSVGAVAVAPADANVVYAGTGEQTLRGNASSGDGLWKSTDAGDTWTFIGLPESHHVGRIRVHPQDPDTLWVAAMGHQSGPNPERGVYRSRDGGASWDRVLFANEQAGAVDLCLDPHNPRIVWATTWRVIRTPYSLESGGPGSGLWRSTDGGDTWTELTRADGLPRGEVGIIGVAASPARAKRVWALIEAEDGGLFRSEDGGKKWQRVNDDRELRQRAWYYTRICADPVDADGVYILNVGFHHSKDGGKSFERISVPHGDNHDLWIDPADPRRMIEANDGGANVSFDGGRTWSTQDNQPTAQLYRVTTDNAVPYRIYAAQQDNSTLRIRSRSDRGRIGERDWEPTAGGESGHLAPHPVDPEIVYGGSYGGYLERVNHRTGERRIVSVWPDNPLGWGAGDLRYRFQWNFPLFFSPHDPGVLYAAGNVLFRSSDDGQSWTPISPDLSRNDKTKLGPSGGPITKDNTGVEYYCTIFAACESPRSPGVLWCGTDDGLLHLSRDGGKSWAEVTPPWPQWTMVNCVEPHPTADGGLYVAATAYKLDDFAPYLFRTDDWGRTWTKITAGIAPRHFCRAIRADPARAGLLYAGTERMVYVSFDDGDRWQPLQLDMPITPITDLAVKDGDLVAATQGRSLWILDDLAHLRQLDPRQAAAAVHLFAPEPVDRMPGRSSRRRDRDAAVGANPPGGAVARIWLAEAPGDRPFAVEWLDGDGNLIRRLATDAKDKDDKLELEAGMNTVEWDLRYPDAKTVPKMILWGAMTSGPRALPGRYQVRLTAGTGDGATVQVRTFDVRPDPRSSSSLADLQAQFAFLIDGRDKLSQTHEAVLATRSIRDQVAGVVAKAEGDGFADLRELGKTIQTEAEAIEQALYQTKNRSAQDPLNYPIRLNNKLGNLLAMVAAGDYRPTDQAIAVKAELTAAIDAELGKLAALQSQDLARFNEMAAAAGIPHVAVEAAGGDGDR